MNQEKDGSNHTLFYDTYALYAIAIGQDGYKDYVFGVKAVTTIMNLYELYYTLLQGNFYREAEMYFERFLPYCADMEPYIIKEAARFRLVNRKLKLSYIDCLGYVAAQHQGIKFLTGDEAFKNMPNVLFVKQ